MRRLFPSVAAVHASADALPFPDDAADAATLIGVVSLTGLRQVVREVARVLSPGGRVVLADMFASSSSFVAGPNRVAGLPAVTVSAAEVGLAVLSVRRWRTEAPQDAIAGRVERMMAMRGWALHGFTRISVTAHTFEGRPPVVARASTSSCSKSRSRGPHVRRAGEA